MKQSARCGLRRSELATGCWIEELPIVVANYRAMLAGEQDEPIADVSGNDAEFGESLE
jgi:hypothetical protein